MGLSPAEAGWSAKLACTPQSCDCGYRLPPALRACWDFRGPETGPGTPNVLTNLRAVTRAARQPDSKELSRSSHRGQRRAVDGNCRPDGNWKERAGEVRVLPGPQMRGISTPGTKTCPWGPRTWGTHSTVSQTHPETRATRPIRNG